MHIAQPHLLRLTRQGRAPVQQRIAGLQVGGGEAHLLPRLNARQQPRRVLKLPLGMDEPSARGQQRPHLLQQRQALGRARQVMQRGKAQHAIPAPVWQGGGPVRVAQVDGLKAQRQTGRGQASHGRLRLVEQRGAEINAPVAAGAALPGPFGRQCAAAAAQVQPAAAGGQRRQHAPHAGLNAPPGGGKRRAKGLVELAVNFEQAGAGGRIHENLGNFGF